MKKLICVLLFVVFLPVVSFAEESSDEICGKWSFYWDLRSFPQELQNVMDYSIMSFDLYLSPDGSANMTKMTMDKKSKLDFSYGALSGVWLGDADSLVIRVGTVTYKAFYDNGMLNIYFTDKIYFPFVHVDQSDMMYSQLVH